MNETITKVNPEIEANTEVTETKVKPYVLKEIKAEHTGLLLTIIRKIGIKEFKSLFSDEAVSEIIGKLVKTYTPKPNTEDAETENTEVTETNNAEDAESKLIQFGITLLPTVLDVVDVILCGYSNCENDLHKFLSKISNLSVEQVKQLSLADFTEMIIDVIKKDDFKDFIKVASKLFK